LFPGHTSATKSPAQIFWLASTRGFVIWPDIFSSCLVVDDIRSRLVLHSPIPSSYSILFSFFPSIFPPLATPPTSIYHIVQRGLVSFAMLLKNFLFLGLAVFSAASPILGHLETRAKTSTAVGTKTGSKGKSGGTTCPNSNAITGATCAGAKFTAVDIEKAVKQAKAM
jgi:hypothetical protein